MLRRSAVLLTFLVLAATPAVHTYGADRGKFRAAFPSRPHVYEQAASTKSPIRRATLYTIGFPRKGPCWASHPAPMPPAYCVAVFQTRSPVEATYLLALIESTLPGTHRVILAGHPGSAGIGTEADLGLNEVTDPQAFASVLVTAAGDTLYEVYSVNTNAAAARAFQSSFAPA